MKAIHYKASILMAGFLNGMSFAPSSANISRLSKTLGSLDVSMEICENGLTEDARSLFGDWEHVRADLMNSYNAAEAELTRQQQAKQTTSQQQHANVITQQHVALRQHAGPIPDPQTLAQYNVIQPDFAERIMRMAEKEQEGRHKREDELVGNQHKQLSVIQTPTE